MNLDVEHFWPKKIASSVQTFKPSGIRAFFDIVATRKDCISLGVGEPDFISPQVVLDSAVKSIRDGFTHYTGNQGLPSLRKAIAEYLNKEYGLEYNFEKEILITVGVSQGLDLAIRSICNPADEILYATPSYVSYYPLIQLAGGRPVGVPLRLEENFKLNFATLRQQINPNSKAILLNYPSNPIGASMTAAEVAELAKVCQEKDLLAISDEIYAELSYEQKHVPIAAMPGMRDRTLLLGGFSKGFAMTGWRIGYICGPQPWIEAVTKIHQYTMLCAPTVSQVAAETALKYAISDRDRMKDAYRQRRDLITEGFNQIGLKTILPEGAFYVFPQISSSGLSSMDFATKLLEAQNVAVIPGSAFGEVGEGFIRCSYATSMDDIKIAIDRIAKFVTRS